jgi:hypothetical protein
MRQVEYLESGLRNAQLGLDAQAAFGKRQRSGNPSEFRTAFQALKSFRAAHERENISNMNFLAWAENLTCTPRVDVTALIFVPESLVENRADLCYVRRSTKSSSPVYM